MKRARVGFRGRVSWLAQSPAVLAVIAVALLIDWLALPCNNADRSVAGSWHGCLRSTLHGRPAMGQGYRINGRLIWAFEEDPRLAPPPNADPANITVFVDLVRRDGWWALTRRSCGYRVWDEAGRAVTGANLREVQGALVEFRRTSGEWFHLDRVLHLIEQGRISEVTVLPMGYVHNAVSGSLALTFLACAAIQSYGGLSRLRSARWVARGRCADCCYQLNAALQTRCPECGARSATLPAG